MFMVLLVHGFRGFDQRQLGRVPHRRDSSRRPCPLPEHCWAVAGLSHSRSKIRPARRRQRWFLVKLKVFITYLEPNLKLQNARPSCGILTSFPYWPPQLENHPSLGIAGSPDDFEEPKHFTEGSLGI